MHFVYFRSMRLHYFRRCTLALSQMTVFLSPLAPAEWLKSTEGYDTTPGGVPGIGVTGVILELVCRGFGIVSVIVGVCLCPIWSSFATRIVMLLCTDRFPVFLQQRSILQQNRWYKCLLYEYCRCILSEYPIINTYSEKDYKRYKKCD